MIIQGPKGEKAMKGIVGGFGKQGEEASAMYPHDGKYV
jgi:hypothetical protein